MRREGPRSAGAQAWKSLVCCPKGTQRKLGLLLGQQRANSCPVNMEPLGPGTVQKLGASLFPLGHTCSFGSRSPWSCPFALLLPSCLTFSSQCLMLLPLLCFPPSCFSPTGDNKHFSLRGQRACDTSPQPGSANSPEISRVQPAPPPLLPGSLFVPQLFCHPQPQ